MTPPTPAPLPNDLGSIDSYLKKGKSATPTSAPKTPATTGDLGSIDSYLNKGAKGAKPAAPAVGRPTATGGRSGISESQVQDANAKPNPLAGAASAAQGVINNLSTPGYFMEDLATRLATPTTKSEQTRMNNEIAKKGYLGWLTSEYATSWKNANAWTTGGEVKHTGGAIAKRLGMTTNDQSFLGKVQNVAAGMLFDVALDPLTYTPVAPVFDAVKGIAKGAAAVAKAPLEVAKGAVTAGGAARALEKTGLAKDAAKEAAAQLDNVEVVKPGYVKPRNAKALAGTPEGKTAVTGAMTKLEKSTTPLKQLPEGVKAPVSETLANAAVMGWDALKSTVLQGAENRSLEDFAKVTAKATKVAAKAATKAGEDYVYHTGEEAAAKAAEPMVPKPSEVNVEPTVGRAPFPEKAPTKFETAMTTVGSRDIKDIQKSVSFVDRIAKQVTGKKAAGAGIADAVKTFIGGVDRGGYEAYSKLPANVKTAVNDAVKMNEYNPKMLYADQAARNNPVSQAFAKSYGSRVFSFSTGRKNIAAYLNENAATSFHKLPTADKKILLTALENMTSDKTGELLGTLTKITGSRDAAQKLAQVGALDGPRGNREAIDRILGNISSSKAGESVKYKGMEDLIAGIQVGDKVNPESLLKIVKAIDPDHPVIVKLEKSATKPSYEMMAQILTGSNTIPETLAAMRKRVNLANTQVFLQATGIGLSDAVAANLDARILGQLALEPEIHAATREVAMQTIARMDQGDATEASLIINEAFGDRFKAVEEELAKQGAHARVSDLGDHAVLGASVPYKGGAAILEHQTGQSFQSIVAAKILGFGTANVAKAAKTELEKQESKLNKFIVRMARVRETLLATTGSRMSIAKERVLVGSDLTNKHVVFIDMGDIAAEFANTEEGKRIIKNALVPSSVDFGKHDGLDVISMLRTARQVLEDVEKNKPHDFEELLAIASEKRGKNAVSKAYTQQLDTFAKDYIAHLTTVAAEGLQKTHMQRAMAATEDYLSHSLDIGEQIINLLKKARQTSLATGWATPELQHAELKQMFNRFAYMADLMRSTDGSVAEAVMRSAAMVLVKGGKLASHEGDALADVYKLFPDKGTEEYSKVMTAINTFARHEDPQLVAPIGREHLPRPEAAFRDKVAAEYQMAKDAINKHIEKSTSLADASELKAWRTEGRALANHMDKIRKAAWNAWLPIEHWSNAAGEWVPADKYDAVAEALWAKENPAILVGDKAEKLGAEMVDPVAEKAAKVDRNAVNKSTKIRNAKVKERQAQSATAFAEDAAVKVLEDAAKFDALGMDPGETGIRMLEEQVFQTVDAGTGKAFIYNGVYNSTEKAMVEGQQLQSRLGNFTSRWSANFARKDVQPIQQMVEATYYAQRTSLAHALNTIHDTYKDVVSHNEMIQIFARSLSGEAVAADASPAIVELQAKVNQVVSAIKYDAEINNIDMDALAKALSSVNLKMKKGATLTETLEHLPFAPPPKGASTSSSDYLEWKAAAEAYAESGISPFAIMIKLGTAIEHVKMNQSLAASLVEMTGYKAYGLTYEQAIKKGWVRMVPIKESDLINAMPTPEQGALFHPEIARQIASLERERAALLAGPDYGKYLSKVATTLMGINRWFKIFQTSINPRHHVTNFVGDSSVELLAGNTSFINWKAATDISNEFGRQMLATDYSKNAIDASMNKLFAGLDAPENIKKDLTAYTKRGEKTIDLIVGGKKRAYTIKQLTDLLRMSGALTENYFNDEVLGVYERMIADDTLSGAQREMYKSVIARMKMQIEKPVKAIGDVTAYYSNIPRAAGAMMVMRSKAWASEKDMLAAVVEHVHLYHPSIQSLASSERHYGRLMVGYYTWQRVMNAATVKMITERAAAVTLVPKLLSNVRQANGVPQTSTGTPWATDAYQYAPQNMRGSIYGPLWYGESGLMGAKTSTPTMDIMDQWQMYYDPALNTNDLIGANLAVLGKFAGSQTNQLTRQVLQEIMGFDMTTGQTYTDRGPNGMAARLLQTLGPVQFLQSQGMPIGTASQLDQSGNVVSKLTPEEQAIKGINWWTGMKEFQVVKPGIQKAAARELSTRIKSLQTKGNK